MIRSWEKAVVYLPGTAETVAIDEVKVDRPYPVAIFLHGCSGIHSGADNRDCEFFCFCHAAFTFVIPGRA